MDALAEHFEGVRLVRGTYHCWRCGGEFPAATLVIHPGRLYPVCEDVERCKRIRERVFRKIVRVLAQ
jgi:hypothetical protein